MLRLMGLHDTRLYQYPHILRINDRDFIVAEAKNEAGDTWLVLKPKPEPKPPIYYVPRTRLYRGMGLASLLALSALLERR